MFIGVYDGHGEAGGEVSHFVRDYFKEAVEEQHGQKSNLEVMKCACNNIDSTLKQAMKETRIDATYAGTTAVMALVEDNEMVIT